ncbi:MAG: Lsr2 family protein [Frankiaceae bacterium]|jgi:hypothetical protein|nr:Lsr2 family protein [Frankiaceae bacterium]
MSSTDAQIRDWARANGVPVGDRGRIPAEVRSAWATENAPDPDPGPQEFRYAPDGTPLFTVGGNGVAEPQPAPQAEPEPEPERPPAPASAAERFRARWRRAREPRETRPRGPRRRRISLETLGELAWGGLARIAATREAYVPVARMMAFQAPVAGMVVEDAAKNTAADTVLQPVARLVSAGTGAGALVGPPLLTAVVCRRPELYPVARPMLVACMKEWVVVAGPKLRELQRREEKFREEMAVFGEEFGLTIDQLLDSVFDGMAAPPPGDDEMAAAAAAGADGQPAG